MEANQSFLQTRLLLIEYALGHSLDELLVFALDHICDIAASPIGFYHFVSDDQKSLTLQQWSTRTLKEFCHTDAKGMHYPVADAGVWVDCVHQKKPVIHNNYELLPHRKGLPAGHAKLVRELVVPVMRRDKVVAILGVGNKATDYTPDDARAISFFADVAWEIVRTKRVEEEQKQTERKYRLAMEAAQEGLWDWDIEHSSVYYSPGWAAILGETEVPALFKSWEDRIHPDDRKTTRKTLQQHLDGKTEFWRYEHRLRMKDGSWKWVVVRGRIVERDMQDRPKRMIGTMIDISAKKQAEVEKEQVLKKLEMRQREQDALLLASREVLGSTDFSGTARKIFDMVCELTGATSGYIALLNEKGDNNDVLFLESGGRPCSVDPALPMPIRGLRSIAYETGQVVFENNFTECEWNHLLPKGHVVLRNVLFAPLKNKNIVVGVLGLANKAGDFSENDKRVVDAFASLAAIALQSSRNVQELKKERDFSESIIETAQAVIIVLDTEGKIVQINNYMEELSGYRLSEVMGKDWFQTFLIPENQKTTCELFMPAISGKSTRGNIDFICTKDNRIIPIEWHEKPLKDEYGKTQGLLAVGIDISERLKLEAQLRQSDKMKAIGQLAGGIAHDFNNILGAIIGFAEMSLDEADPESFIGRNLYRILSAGDRAKNLVNQILAFSRQHGEKKVPIFIRPILKEVIQLLRATLPTTIDIRHTLAGDTKPVLADATRIHEIVMNLCTNAAYAIGEKGVIKITHCEKKVESMLESRWFITPPGWYSVISIKDNGIGIPVETLPNIFEPFFTTKAVGEGTGMGLSVVFGILESHGGNIFVDSRPEKGSCFTVYLPKTEERYILEQDEEITVQGGSERIMLIDDEEILMIVLKEMLEKMGYSVQTFSSSKKALKEFVRKPDAYDLVITDQTMPGLTGIELAQCMLKKRKDLPIILCTGYSRTVDENTAREAGIKDFVLKPVYKKDLAAQIRRVLDEFGRKH
ncbi:MAG: GAF domain-containing protein [Spirochaetales bacterium]|nr:GAF domain-containing protein [Spirochaetales bacterium]